MGKICLVLLMVKICFVAIAAGEEVHSGLLGSNATYAPGTAGHLTSAHVTANSDVKGMQNVTRNSYHTTHGNNHSEKECKDLHIDDQHDEKGHSGSHKSKKIHVVEFNFEHVRTPLLFGLVVIVAGLSKIGFHHANFLSSKVPESCILIILGVIFGAIFFLTGVGDDLDFFQPDQFFLYLLPPIILEASFSLHDRTFTDNLGSIIMFSVVGTVIACFAIVLQLYKLKLMVLGCNKTDQSKASPAEGAHRLRGTLQSEFPHSHTNQHRPDGHPWSQMFMAENSKGRRSSL